MLDAVLYRAFIAALFGAAIDAHENSAFRKGFCDTFFAHGGFDFCIRDKLFGVFAQRALSVVRLSCTDTVCGALSSST